MAKERVPTKQLRARVKVECARRGMTLTALAKRCGRSAQWLNDVLGRENPKLDTLRLLADALGCPVARLVKPVTTEEFGKAMMPK